MAFAFTPSFENFEDFEHYIFGIIISVTICRNKIRYGFSNASVELNLFGVITCAVSTSRDYVEQKRKQKNSETRKYFFIADDLLQNTQFVEIPLN